MQTRGEQVNLERGPFPPVIDTNPVDWKTTNPYKVLISWIDRFFLF